MQPVLLGRSFAPLQGETGQWTAEMHSNHQTTVESVKTTVKEKTKAFISLHRNVPCCC